MAAPIGNLYSWQDFIQKNDWHLKSKEEKGNTTNRMPLSIIHLITFYRF